MAETCVIDEHGICKRSSMNASLCDFKSCPGPAPAVQHSGRAPNPNRSGDPAYVTSQSIVAAEDTDASDALVDELDAYIGNDFFPTFKASELLRKAAAALRSLGAKERRVVPNCGNNMLCEGQRRFCERARDHEGDCAARPFGDGTGYAWPTSCGFTNEVRRLSAADLAALLDAGDKT